MCFECVLILSVGAADGTNRGELNSQVTERGKKLKRGIDENRGDQVLNKVCACVHSCMFVFIRE